MSYTLDSESAWLHYFFLISFQKIYSCYFKVPSLSIINETMIYTGLEKQIFSTEIVIIFLPIPLRYVLGAPENRLIETVLLSTHNICFGWEIRRKKFCYSPLTKGLL